MESNTGLDRDEIEIDFTKSKNNIIMLLGGNGSGKSTIMSALTPYKDSFDNRKNLVLDGCEGRKEIDYEHNGHKYDIVHIYGSTSQSFIMKDGEELNKNGGVRTCEDIIATEFGVSRDYFKIGNIGSNTKSFIDFTTSDRKNYITTFLNIDEMAKKFSIAKSKLSGLKKDITTISNELKNFEDKSVVETKIKSSEEELKNTEAELKILLPKEGALKTQIERDTQDIGTITLENLNSKKIEKENDITVNNTIKTELENSLSNTKEADSEKEKLQTEISSLQGDLKVNETEKTNKNLLILDYKNKISSLELEMKALGSPEDIENTKKQIQSDQEKAENLKIKIRSNNIAEFVNEQLKARRDIQRDLHRFTTFTNFIEKYFSDLQKNSVINTQTNIELFFSDDFENSLKRQIGESRSVISAKQTQLNNENQERAKLSSYVSQLSNLEKRPSECTIDSCPFIKEALSHKNILNEINEKDNLIKQIKTDLDVLSVKADNIQELSNIFTLFNNAFESVGPRDNSIFAYFIKEKSLIEWVKGKLSDFQKSRQEIIDGINEAVSDFQEYSSLISSIRSNEVVLKKLTDSDSSLKEKYESDIAENKEKIETLQKEYSELETSGREISTKLQSKQELLQKYSDYLQAISKSASATTMLNTILSDIKRVSLLIENKTKAETELVETKKRISYLTSLKTNKTAEVTNLKTQLTQINALLLKLESFNKMYKPTEAVSNALSPIVGIPLILIKVYLGETEKIANELLSIAYGDDFKIKFETTEKDFKIKVIAKDNVKEDIKLASQGEIALTTISISLALIEQSIGEYNILCLDEIDGALDYSNRGNFINILDGQIQKLGIEQIFVISHNNAFDLCPMDMILLRDSKYDRNSELNENKNIIFDYEE